MRDYRSSLFGLALPAVIWHARTRIRGDVSVRERYWLRSCLLSQYAATNAWVHDGQHDISNEINGDDTPCQEKDDRTRELLIV